MSAIQADYRTTKHIPSRKCYQLILEVPEEEFPEVCKVLGYPKTGENTYVGIALLDMGSLERSNSRHVNNTISDKTEGEKLRTRAVMLCDRPDFQEYVKLYGYNVGSNIENAKTFICLMCDINSRSELATNIEAQDRFKQLLAEFNAWKLSQQYADNLSR